VSVELGLDTFGDMTVGDDGTPSSGAQVLRDLVAQGVLADQVGVDFLGIGEHHRPDFAVSAPDVVLAGLATVTSRIRLGSAVTVLSSDDPIRVFQRFSTIDALSGGRAEVILGRGSFTESFPLFGLDLGDYERLFSEKLDLFSRLLAEEPVSWEGTIRPPLADQEVFPRTEAGLRAWIAVGGSPQSVVRAATYRLPLMLAIIGGPAHRFAPFADLYRRALSELGAEPLPVGVHSPGHVADTDEQARQELYAPFKANRDRIGAERGWAPMQPSEFDSEITHGALYVGSPETVARKIATTVRTLGLDRFDLKYASGPMPHSQLMRSVELYGTRVIPRVRELLAEG
jgi:probable LLM family oxidoreductase